MANIDEARGAAAEFLRHALSVNEVRVIGASKVNDHWDVEAEVYGENAFLKSLGLPTRVQELKHYVVRLNESLEVESYERQSDTAVTS